MRWLGDERVDNWDPMRGMWTLRDMTELVIIISSQKIFESDDDCSA